MHDPRPSPMESLQNSSTGLSPGGASLGEHRGLCRATSPPQWRLLPPGLREERGEASGGGWPDFRKQTCGAFGGVPGGQGELTGGRKAAQA